MPRIQTTRTVKISLFALCDGERAQVVATAQDHKRAFDGDAIP